MQLPGAIRVLEENVALCLNATAGNPWRHNAKNKNKNKNKKGFLCQNCSREETQESKKTFEHMFWRMVNGAIGRRRWVHSETTIMSTRKRTRRDRCARIDNNFLVENDVRGCPHVTNLGMSARSEVASDTAYGSGDNGVADMVCELRMTFACKIADLSAQSLCGESEAMVELVFLKKPYAATSSQVEIETIDTCSCACLMKRRFITLRARERFAVLVHWAKCL